jgi:Phage integrase, N-terminal
MARNLKGKLAELAKHHCGGSHLTKEARENTVKQFADFLKSAFTGNIREPAQIRTHHIEHYARSLQGQVWAYVGEPAFTHSVGDVRRG